MKKFIFVAIVSFFTTSCELIGSIWDDIMNPDQDKEIYLSFEQLSDTRVEVDDEGQMVWTESDKVSVFYNNSGNSCWAFLGQTGERVGAFAEQIPIDGEELDLRVVLYPYSDEYTLSAVEEVVYATIPPLQNNTELYRLMIASGVEDEFTLKNLCGVLHLQITGDKRVTKIVVNGNNDEILAGQIAVNYLDYSVSFVSGEREVTLDLGDGVQLSAEPTDFYVAIASQTLEQGVSVTAVYSDDTSAEQELKQEIKLPVHLIYPVAIDLGGGNSDAGDDDGGEGDDGGNDDGTGDDEEGGDLIAPKYVPQTEIWYISSDEQIIEPDNDDFGAKILSNTYENGKGVIKFDDIVTRVGDSAFSYSKRLVRIAVPESVTKIGDSAFSGCEALVKFSIPKNVTELGYGIFSTCTSLEQVIIRDGIQKITRTMFSECFKLTSVYIPDTVTTIEMHAFDCCYRLTDVQLGSHITTIEPYAFYKNVRLQSIFIPLRVTTIGEGVFSECTALESVTLCDRVQSIGAKAFYGCTKLREFNGEFASADKRCVVIDDQLCAFAPADLSEYTIPNYVKVIGGSVFFECKSLKTVTIPDDATTIGDKAFAGSGITNIVIPNRVTTIGNSAFSGCNYLDDITIGCRVESIGEDAFSAGGITDVRIVDLEVWSKISFADDKSNPLNGATNIHVAGIQLTELVLPTDVSPYAFYGCSLERVVAGPKVGQIGDYAFGKCRKLKSVELDPVTHIKQYAFTECEALEELTLGGGLTTIDMYAFSSCTSLAKVTIPRLVTAIGASAFRSCYALKEVYCQPETPPTAGVYYGWKAFDGNAADRKIYVGALYLDSYKTAAYWSSYADYIVSYSD